MLKKHEKATIIRLFYRPFYTFAARKHIHPSTMKKILRVVSPNDYARYVDAPVLHPLVSVICYDEVCMVCSSPSFYPLLQTHNRPDAQRVPGEIADVAEL